MEERSECNKPSGVILVSPDLSEYFRICFRIKVEMKGGALEPFGLCKASTNPIIM